MQMSMKDVSNANMHEGFCKCEHTRKVLQMTTCMEDFASASVHEGFCMCQRA